MISNKLTLILFLLLVNSAPGWTQKTSKPTSLRLILTTLEERFTVSFTYADETIADIFIETPHDTLNITEAISYLRASTGLQFHQLNDRFITISKPSAEKINICGYLIDAEDETRLAGATIIIDDKFTVSGKDGFFSIKDVAAGSHIFIHMLSYKTKGVPAESINSKTACSFIALESATTQLQGVMVTNYITTGISREVNGAFLVNIDSLGILPGLTEPDILQTIQALPGIQSINETVSHINVRGGTNDQNLVLWDGIKMYQTGHFFGLISAFNPYLNKDITIVKNGTSAALDDGVSGIIDIHSDRELTKTFSGGAGINMINADVFFKIPVSKKISLQLSGRRAITDLVKTPVFNNYFERAFGNSEVTRITQNSGDTTFNSNENFYFYDIGGNLLFDISKKDKLQLHFLTIFNELDYQENLIVDSITSSKTSSLKQQSFATGLNYQRLWNRRLRTTAQLYLSSYTLHAINFDVRNNQRLIQENEVLDTGIKLDALWRFSNRWDLLSGYQFQEIGIGNLEEINNPEFRRYIKRVIRTHVGFAEANYKSKSNRTNIRFGLRANYFSKFSKFIIEPRLAFNQKFMNFFSLEILGEFKSQSATQVIDLQNDFLGVEKRRWVLANENDIPLIVSKQVSSGVNFNKNGLLISLEGFYKYVDGITSSSQGFQNQFQYTRASGSYSIYGAELLINKKFKHISSWVSYSYTDNQYEFSTFTPPVFANNLDITHAGTLGVNANLKKFELSTGVNWHTGKPYTLPEGIIGNQISYQTPNNVRLANYLRVDFSARYNFKLSKGMNAQVGGSVWNLTNNKNLYNIYYQIDEKGEVQEIQQFALGITPNLMFRISF